MRTLYRVNCFIGSCPTIELDEGGVLYRAQCGVGACPEVSHQGEMVVIHDPDKPERGKVFLTKEEWNDIKQNAPLIE